MRDDYRLVSPPVELFWQGWRANTVTLQNHGWNISAHQDNMTYAVRLLVQSPNKDIRGFTNIDREFWYRNFDCMNSKYESQTMPMELGANIQVQRPILMRDFNSDLISPIDATPRYEEFKSQNLRDFNLFRTIPKETPEIILSEHSMAEILDMALSKQEPAQKEIRKRMLRDRELKLNNNIRAQLCVSA